MDEEDTAELLAAAVDVALDVRLIEENEGDSREDTPTKEEEPSTDDDNKSDGIAHLVIVTSVELTTSDDEDTESVSVELTTGATSADTVASDAAASDAAAAATVSSENDALDTQVDTPTDIVINEIIDLFVPECGIPIVPIPTIVAKTIKPRKSRGGMLMPWHSTRSIGHYHTSTRGSGGHGAGKGGRSKSSQNSTKTIMRSTISSVHSFRG